MLVKESLVFTSFLLLLLNKTLNDPRTQVYDIIGVEMGRNKRKCIITDVCL